MTAKVFCIGFHKTGTKSLAAALEILGYRVTGPNGVQDPDIARNVHALAHCLAAQYDAFQDNPWPVIYRELDPAWPGSRFILTIRDSSAWISSVVRHFGETQTPMRKWIYGAGCPKGNEGVYIQRFNRHNREVVGYFRRRPGDLLIMDLTGGDGWEPLCGFLGKPVPACAFPHVNRADDRRKPPGLSG